MGLLIHPVCCPSQCYQSSLDHSSKFIMSDCRLEGFGTRKMTFPRTLIKTNTNLIRSDGRRKHYPTCMNAEIQASTNSCVIRSRQSQLSFSRDAIRSKNSTSSCCIFVSLLKQVLKFRYKRNTLFPSKSYRFTNPVFSKLSRIRLPKTQSNDKLWGIFSQGILGSCLVAQQSS